MPAVSAKPYKPPSPIFRPAPLSGLEAEIAAFGISEENESGKSYAHPAKMGTYAGAGSYF
jgi:hypothetical protein